MKPVKSRPRRRCQFGYHRRTAVNWHHDRAFSECGYCGVDLIRSRRGWRSARQEELPTEWRSEHNAPVELTIAQSKWLPLMAASLLIFVGLALIVTLKYA